MKVEIDPFRTPSRSPRYCSNCEEMVMDVYTDKMERKCPVCGDPPSLLELGTDGGNV